MSEEELPVTPSAKELAWKEFRISIDKQLKRPIDVDDIILCEGPKRRKFADLFTRTSEQGKI